MPVHSSIHRLLFGELFLQRGCPGLGAKLSHFSAGLACTRPGAQSFTQPSLGTVTRNCNPSTQEVETGRLEFEIILGYKVSLRPALRLSLKKRKQRKLSLLVSLQPWRAGGLLFHWCTGLERPQRQPAQLEAIGETSLRWCPLRWCPLVSTAVHRPS